jgi:hypothetical protein
MKSGFIIISNIFRINGGIELTQKIHLFLAFTTVYREWQMFGLQPRWHPAGLATIPVIPLGCMMGSLQPLVFVGNGNAETQLSCNRGHCSERTKRNGVVFRARWNWALDFLAEE